MGRAMMITSVKMLTAVHISPVIKKETNARVMGKQGHLRQLTKYGNPVVDLCSSWITLIYTGSAQVHSTNSIRVGKEKVFDAHAGLLDHRLSCG